VNRLLGTVKRSNLNEPVELPTNPSCPRQQRTSPWYQLHCLAFEVAAIVNRKVWRWYTCWFTASFWIIATYRVNRFCFLLLGRAWPILRVGLAPIFFLVSPWTGCHEIHYEADIGCGLQILHPTLGIQISRKAIIGDNLQLVGGNAIGRRRYQSGDRPVLGNNIQVGMGAIILGPVQIGDNAQIGAGAVVLDDVPAGTVVAGVPARGLHLHTTDCPDVSSLL
jgi:serine acetyltransferase